MADLDSRQVMARVEKSDNSKFPHLDSTIRFLAASDAFGAGVNVSDIHKVFNSGIPQSRNSDTQRQGRCAQGLLEDLHFLVVPRGACKTMDSKKTKGGARSDPLIEAAILGQIDSDSDSQCPQCV